MEGRVIISSLHNLFFSVELTNFGTFLLIFVKFLLSFAKNNAI